MIAALALAPLALAAQAVAAAPAPPASLATIPALRFVGAAPQQDPDAARFVREEVAAGRCAAAVHGAQGYTLKVELAVLADADGQARRVVPVAIDCPTVEQYAAGIVSAMARRNVDVADASGAGWYRTTLTFAWTS